MNQRSATSIKIVLMCAVISSVLALNAYALAKSPEAWAKENIEDLGTLYRHFHANPELSLHEKETAARLKAQWEAIGFQVEDQIGGHGIVGTFSNGEGGPTLMLRCDMDALPVTEQTNLSYASQVRVKNASGTDVGVMHACGHDIHMTNLVGVAQYLLSHKDQWRGKLMLVGQPAEELGMGAKAMLEDGLFERFGKPDFALALHVDPVLPAGSLRYRAGYTMANVDSVDIVVRGRGGHGAYPHATVDPVVQAAELVLGLQTIISREVSPTEPAVITVGSVHGGTKHNIIGNDCHLQLTVRSYSPKVRSFLLSAIERKAKSVAQGARAPAPTVSISEGTPALRNDKNLTDRLTPVFKDALGDDRVLVSEPVMGGEDFSRYGLAGVPILMLQLGSVDARRLQRFQQLGQTPPSLHSPQFYPDYEATLITGIAAMSSAALELLAP